MIPIELPIEQLENAADMLKAMAHPMRIAIISFLSGAESHTVKEIHEKLKITQSATSQHLGVLRNKGILTVVRKGQNSYYNVRQDKLSTLIDCLRVCVCD